MDKKQQQIYNERYQIIGSNGDKQIRREKGSEINICSIKKEFERCYFKKSS